jgi:hypothetical protein
MTVRCYVLVCVLVLSSVEFFATAAEDDPEVFLFSMGLDEKSELVWAMKRSRLLAVPAWQPGGTKEAPLSPNKAATVASDYVQNTLGVHGATVFTMHILTLGFSYNDRWGYDIGFTTDPPLLSDDPRLEHVHVAMDGKVMVPEKRPRQQH